MSCTSPLVRIETTSMYMNKKGGWSYKAYFGDRIKYDKGEYDNIDPNYIRSVTLIGCGKCLECRLQKSRDWATRMMLELKNKNKEECHFLTFTYNDEHLPIHETVNEQTGEIITGRSLRKEDMQKLWKRIRKKNPNLKYLMCGEYGSNTNRPHYHAIVYNLKLDKRKFRKIGVNEWGQPLYQSDEMDDFWRQEHISVDHEKFYSKIGNVTIAEVTWESCAYVARYTVKKTTEQQDPNFHAAQGQIDEYITMSKNIGMDFYKQNKDTIWLSDTVPVLNKKTGTFTKPPLAFRRKLKEENEELYNNITEKRKAQAEVAQAQKDKQTDLSREEQRKLKERQNQSYKDWRKECS